MGEDLRVPGHDEGSTVPFTLDGKEVKGLEGDTVASALHARGIRVLGRSIRYHRPRGYFCGVGKCGNCLVRVNGDPNVRACTTRIEPGMDVQRQSGWPSADLDVLGAVDRIFPRGFDYHERFLRPKALVPVYNRVIRELAGFGDPPPRTPEPTDHEPMEEVQVDVAVVGGGPAGLAAAHAASETVERLLLVEEAPELGGELLLHEEPLEGDTPWSGSPGPEAARTLTTTLEDRTAVRVETEAAAVGLYPDRTLVVDAPRRLLEVHAERIVLAPGTHEAPPAIPRNDLPGIMGGRGARLLLRHGVLPGRVVVVTGPRGDAATVARALEDAGAKVVAEPGTEVVEAHGGRFLEGVTLRTAEGEERRSCDALVVTGTRYPRVELLQQAGVPLTRGDERGALYPEARPDGTTPVPWCHVAGEVAGRKPPHLALLQGRAAGLQAAAGAGGASELAEESKRLLERLTHHLEGSA